MKDDYSWAQPETRAMLERHDRDRRRANVNLAFSGFAVLLSLVALVYSLMAVFNP